MSKKNYLKHISLQYIEWDIWKSIHTILKGHIFMEQEIREATKNLKKMSLITKKKLDDLSGIGLEISRSYGNNLNWG